MPKPITRSERSRVAFPRVLNISDLRQIAERRIPRVVFDYLDGGADAEVTLGEACRVYDRVLFRPQGAVAFSERDLHVCVLGMDLELPFLLGPVGSRGAVDVRTPIEKKKVDTPPLVEMQLAGD